MHFEKWLSAHEIIRRERKEEPVLYKEIGADDIKQGALGDCYFLSSIASLAETETRKIEGGFSRVLSTMMANNTPQLNATGI